MVPPVSWGKDVPMFVLHTCSLHKGVVNINMIPSKHTA